MEKIEIWIGGFRLRATGRITVTGVFAGVCWAMTYFQERLSY